MIDAGTVRTNQFPATAPRRLSDEGRTRALCAVGEYLRDWGWRDPERIAAESRRIVQKAVDRLPPPEIGAPTAAGKRRCLLCELSVRIASEEMEQSLARLASEQHQGGVIPAVVSLTPRLAGTAGELTQAIHSSQRVASQLGQIRQAIAVPIIPRPRPRAMHAQPRTRLWKWMRPAYWTWAVRRMTTLLSGSRQRKVSA